MKNKWKIFLPVSLIAFALVCIFGGQALVKWDSDRRLEELKAQNSVAPEVTSSAAPENVVYTLPPVVTYTLPPATTGSSAPATDNVEVDEEGNQVITPDFENQGNGAVEIVEPGVQVTANIGGGAGEVLPTESDGAYHGESQPPAATPSPAPTTASTATPVATPTPVPTATPKPTQAPEATPTATPAPAQTTTPVPTEKPVDANGKPTWAGSYDGEMYGDWEWWKEGSGGTWVNKNSSNGGIGGQIEDPDPNTEGLSGEKVGNM